VSDQPAEVTSEVPELDWRMLHPASVAVNLLPRTLAVLRGAWPLLLLIFFNRDRSAGLANSVDLLILMMFFVSTVGQTLVHFLTLRYRVNAGRLEIRTGILNRNVRVIDPDRIQNTEMYRNVAHRLSGLVEVRIETASGTEVEGLLSALTFEDAEELVDALERSKKRSRPATEEIEPPSVVVDNTIWDLIRYGATATRVGAVAVIIIGVMLDGTTYVAPDSAAELEARMTTLALIVGVIAVFSSAWVFGIGSVILRHFGFELTIDGDSLVAAEGLFNTRRVELKLHKVQLLLVSQPLLRRLAGFGSLHIETAAAREEGGGVVAAATTVPVVESVDIDRVVRTALPSADIAVADGTFHRPHPRALYREVALSIVRTVFFGLFAWWMFGNLGALVFGWLPFAVFAAWLDYQFQGWVVTDKVVATRRGYWNRTTTIIAREKLQSLERFQGPIQRLIGLAFLRVRVAGNSVLLPEIALADADAVREQLSGRQNPSVAT